ncbi:MAG: hypothetical protein HQK83_05600 [Fibrobacteria bacterium]|nr:hypothetical protein [Fibrobacteria bacterium]
MKKKIFVACKLSDVGVKKLKNQKDFSVTVIPKPTAEELITNISTAEGIIIKSNVKLTADVLEYAKKLKVICRAGAGVDNIDLKKASEMGIPVTNTPGLNSNSVAEQVFCYVNTLYKNICVYDNSVKTGLWEKGKYPINELKGKTIGIGGLGAIGRLVLEKAKGYRMKVKVYDPFVSSSLGADLGFDFVSDIKELFKTCDIVTVHMPATAETKNSITKEVLCSMKENAIFINTARGTLLPENALEQALAKHKTLKAAIDVYLVEKPGEKKLAKFGSRVVLTPHVCGNAIEGQLEIAELCADIIIDAVTKNKLRNLVNFVKIPEDLSQSFLDLSVGLGHLAASLNASKGQLEEIRITCYGGIQKYGDLLIKPAIKGVLSQMLNENITLINADAKAQELGIKTVLREPADAKNYGDSITVDVVVHEKKKLLETSVRGKLIEGMPVIMKVDHYEDLQVRPQGHQLYFLYDNKPGVIGSIASLLGESKINIESILACNDSEKGKKQLLVIRTEQCIPEKVLSKLKEKTIAKSKTKVYGCQTVDFDSL